MLNVIHLLTHLLTISDSRVSLETRRGTPADSPDLVPDAIRPSKSLQERARCAGSPPPLAPGADIAPENGLRGIFNGVAPAACDANMSSERRRLIAGTGWTLTSTFMGIVVGLVLNFIVVAFLAVSGYGEWASATALASMFGLGGDLGVAGALTKLVAERQGKHTQHGTLVSSALIVGLLAGVTSGVALAILSSVVEQTVSFPNYATLLRILAIQMPVNLGASSLLALLQGRRSFRTISLILIFQSLVGLVLTALFLFLGLGVVGVLLASLFAGSVTLGVLIFSARATLAIGGWQSLLRDLHTLVPFGLQLVFMNGFSTVLYQIDVVVLSVLTNDAAVVGTYAVAIFLTRGLWIIPNSISSTTYPVVSEYTAANNQDRVGRYMSTALLAAIAITGSLGVAFILFGQPVIRLLFGQEAVPAYGLAVALLLGTGLLGTLRSIAPSLPAVGRPDIGMWISMLGAVSLTITSVIFVSVWGAFGAAIAVCCVFTAVALTLMWAIRHYVLKVGHFFNEKGRIVVTGGFALGAGVFSLFVALPPETGLLQLLMAFGLWLAVIVVILILSGGRTTWGGMFERRSSLLSERT